MAGNTTRSKALISIFAAALCLLLFPAKAPAYSVLAHEAVVDASWEGAIKPLLLARYPNSTPEQLAEARSYSYGGSIIHLSPGREQDHTAHDSCGLGAETR